MCCLLRLFIVLSVMLTVISAVAGDVQTNIKASNCFVDGWQEPLRCYRVPVANGGEAISVLVAPEIAASGREPLYLLAGGPGQAASDLAPLLNAFRPINRERAIVLVDRRGSGRSHAFDCGFNTKVPTNLQILIRKLEKCYTAQPELARSLNSRLAVDDLESVRKFLGHNKIILWGGSWGTRTALLYQQWYPQALEALVLDAVAPIETKVFLAASAAEQALLNLQEACKRDAVCVSFGDWHRQLKNLLNNWTKEQAQNFPDPLTGLPAVQSMEAPVLANAVRAALYNPTTAAQLPFAIQQTERGNFLPLSGLVGLVSESSEAMAMGLTLSVACAEEVHRISTAEIAADTDDSFVGKAFIDPFVQGCAVWPVPKQKYAKPQPRAHPVLLISGSADPITPPHYAQQQLGYLANKQHLIVGGGGHINSMRGCIPDLIAEFLDAPLKPLNDACVADIQRPPFMAGTFGPILAVGEVLSGAEKGAMQ